jgi:putative transposase
MPWRLASQVSEREKFVADYNSGLFPFAELCRMYGVSRKTGYLWLKRWQEGGAEALRDRSRRPHSSPMATPREVVQLLVAKRRKYPSWGATKLLQLVQEDHPELKLPSLCTANRILDREGLLAGRKRRQRQRGFQKPWVEPQHPNEIWTIDFKGQFVLGDRNWCYPLTQADAFSRKLLVLRALTNTRFDSMWPVVERSFREYGMPGAILSDNGPPFGAQAICGLSSFAIRLLKLGIDVIRIEPGHPEQNGRHERMHRTLEAVIRPARQNVSAQQRVFNAFRKEFNTVRPHAALQGKRPSDLYRPSARQYPGKDLPGLEYPFCYDRRQVRTGGFIKWHGKEVFISKLLEHEPVGLYPVDEGIWDVYFGPLKIGRLSDAGVFRQEKPPRKPRRRSANAAPDGSRLGEQEKEKVLPKS